LSKQEIAAFKVSCEFVRVSRHVEKKHTLKLRWIFHQGFVYLRLDQL